MALPEFITHITATGDRWDLLAWRFYGDPTQYSPIVMANASVPVEPVFEAGISVAIPILDVARMPVNLPPWKRTRGGNK